MMSGGTGKVFLMGSIVVLVIAIGMPVLKTATNGETADANRNAVNTAQSDIPYATDEVVEDDDSDTVLIAQTENRNESETETEAVSDEDNASGVIENSGASASGDPNVEPETSEINASSEDNAGNEEVISEDQREDEEAFAALNIDYDGSAGPAEGTSTAGLFIRLVLSLGIVVGLIYASRRFLRIFSDKGKVTERGDMVKVVSSTDLGGNRAVHVIEVLDGMLIVGASDGGVNLIKEIPSSQIESLRSNIKSVELGQIESKDGTFDAEVDIAGASIDGGSFNREDQQQGLMDRIRWLTTKRI